MKIAVVGAGISGLTCAHYLSAQHEVHVFESLSYIGGHTNTIDVNVPSGRYNVDTGFIVFNDRTYPKFIQLMNSLGVESQLSDMSFSVKVESSGLEYNGNSLNTLFAQRRNLVRPSFYKMISDILRFNREAPAVLDNNHSEAADSLETYLVRHQYSPQFMDHYIIPMGAAIWSAGVEQMKMFPISYFVRFFKNHGMLSVNDRPQWRVIKNGSRSYIPALTQRFRERLFVNTPVTNIRRTSQGVLLSLQRERNIEEDSFDHVILAGHADQMLPLLSDASPVERQVMGKFLYQENNTVLHTDSRVLPKRKLAWASWNYWVPQERRSRVAVTYNMNILQRLSAPETFLVSLNMEDQIDPQKILKKIVYHHPIYNSQSVEAQAQWSLISGVQNTHYCGAYWGYGFHEDGVASAHRVCEQFGVEI